MNITSTANFAGSTCHIPHAPRTKRPTLMMMIATARQRFALSKLDAQQLADLGLSRDEIQAEIRKPFWDVPAHLLNR